jgi:phosphoglycolate phosphatase
MNDRCLVFDLDGTLIDSVPDLAAALNRLMAARGLAGFGLPEVSAMVGDGAAVLVQRALAARDRPADEAAVDAFVADYTAHAAEATRPFPGVMETLPGLVASGWRLAVCTNKPVAAAHEVLRALGLDGFFAAVGGGDSYPVHKPDPAHLLATLREAGGDAARSVMVGDHRNDVAAANGAGLPCIFAAWGYGPRAMGAAAAMVAERFADVPEMAARLIEDAA